MQRQRKQTAARRPPPTVAARPEFTAAVRYHSGRRELFRVRNADDMSDARAVVLAELDNVQSVVIALRN
ncbi:MAG TPA: hypothetical protein PLU47_12015 [Azonexus sp.]|nr:hypothetical protein [Azonexus sp.]